MLWKGLFQEEPFYSVALPLSLFCIEYCHHAIQHEVFSRVWPVPCYITSRYIALESCCSLLLGVLAKIKCRSCCSSLCVLNNSREWTSGGTRVRCSQMSLPSQFLWQGSTSLLAVVTHLFLWREVKTFCISVSACLSCGHVLCLKLHIHYSIDHIWSKRSTQHWTVIHSWHWEALSKHSLTCRVQLQLVLCPAVGNSRGHAPVPLPFKVTSSWLEMKGAVVFWKTF